MKHTTYLLPLLALLLIPACDDDHDDGHNHDHEADAGSALPDASSIDAGNQSITLQFAAKVGAEDFQCSEAGTAKIYSGVGSQPSEVSFKDFRFYVSNIRLINSTGDEVPLAMDSDGAFQLQQGDDHVALLDFEDGTANCSDVGNANLNSRVTGSVTPGTYTGVVFELGVPFTMNHLDVGTAVSPLNISSLYWAWAIGHKFMRLDLDVAGTPWNVHIGSIMCTTDGMTSPPSEECARPNRATIRLEGFDPATDTIEFDAAAIVAQSDITANLGQPTPGCQSFPHDEPDCTSLFSTLGITYTTGSCTTDCSEQTPFRIAK